MSIAWDYVMPHRLLINKSLRKEADKLREDIDSYQIEYDRKADACQKRLEKAERDNQSRQRNIKESLLEKLQEEQDVLNAIATKIVAYANGYVYLSYLRQAEIIKREQIKLLKEEEDFLSEQMSLIGQEIDLLKARQVELSASSNVNDIIALANVSGFDLVLESDDDARTLMVKLTSIIGNCDRSSVEYYALERLKEIVQERAEYLSIIKYIGWVIQQKIEYSKQLSGKRRAIRNSRKNASQDLRRIKDEILSSNSNLEQVAANIRNYWVQPITYLDADISYINKEIHETRDKQEDVERLQKHEHNDLLNREWQDLSSEICSLNRTIRTKKNEKNIWFDRRNFVIDTFEKALGPSAKKRFTKKIVADEVLFIEIRLSELEQIRIDGVNDAQMIYEEQRAKIESDYKNTCSAVDASISECSVRKNGIVAEYAAARRKTATARAKVNQLKEEDDRSIFIKFFMISPEIEAAEKELTFAINAEECLKQKITEVEQVIDIKKQEGVALAKKRDSALDNCKPKYLRPTQDEAKEEKKLRLLKKELEKRK